MNDDLANFDFIPHRSKSERQWVVRASSGRYVQHFLKDSVVATGHINGFKDISDPSQLSIPDIKKLLNTKTIDGHFPHPSTVTNHATQISDFIHEMSPDDLVITLDSNTVAIGRVAGNAYIDDEPVEIKTQSRSGIPSSSKMPYELRRKVNWGPSSKRSELPMSVEHTMRAHQAVFNIDRHWEYLYHLIYPVFKDDSNLYFSSLIRQPDNIESYHVSQLLGYFSDIEAISKQLDFDSISPEMLNNYYELLNQYNRNIDHELVCKAQFFSEGSIWWKQPVQWASDYKRTIGILLAVQVLFGGDIGFIENPGIITPEMRNNMTSFILKTYEARDMDNVKKALQLKPPIHDTKPLEKKQNKDIKVSKN